MTALAVQHRRGMQIYLEKQKKRKTAELIAEVFAVDRAMQEWAREFPEECLAEFQATAGLAL